MILIMVKGYNIPFTSLPKKLAVPSSHLFQTEKILVDQEVQFIKMEGVISIVEPVPERFLCSIFLAKKKDGGIQPVINLKDLNRKISFVHFQMEKFLCFKRNANARGSDVQNRSERCIFCSHFNKENSEISHFNGWLN